MSRWFDNVFNYSHAGDIKVNIGFDSDKAVSISPKIFDEVLLLSMFKPKVKSRINKEIKESKVNLDYKCEQGKCKFAEALLNIRQSDELEGLGVRELATKIVESIEKNPDAYVAHTTGGFVLQSMGTSFLHLKNNSEGVAVDCRYGFVDLTEVRRKLLYLATAEHDKRESNINTFMYSAGSAMLSSIITLRVLSWFKKI